MDSQNQKSSKQIVYFPNLDSIRFFAALMVFLSHGIKPSFDFLPIQGSLLEKVLLTISSGGTGVSVFFVLSGFLITYLLLTEKSFSGSIDVKKFYWRRILRIWPMYFAVVLFTFGIYPFLKNFFGISTDLGSNLWFHLTFLSNFDVINILQHCYGSDAMSQNITWSVSIEEQFYLVWPVLMILVPSRFLPLMILILITLSIGFQLYHHDDEFILYYHTISKLIDLAMGGLVAYFAFSKISFRNFFLGFTPNHHIALFSITFLWLFIKNDILPEAYAEVIAKPICVILFSMIIASQCFISGESSWNLGRIRFANSFGKYTYGIYLLHPIVLTLMSVVLRIFNISINTFLASFLFGLVGLVLTLWVSYMSFRYYESRFLRLKRNYSVITHD